MTREQLIKEQVTDAELSCLMEEAVDEEEATKYGNFFYIKLGVLMRKWTPPDIPASNDCQVVYQILIFVDMVLLVWLMTSSGWTFRGK